MARVQMKMAAMLMLVIAAVSHAEPAEEEGIAQDFLVQPAHPFAQLFNKFTMVFRSQWSARAPRFTTRLSTPVSHVIIHHTVTGACTTQAACSTQMRSIQNHHMDGNGWIDIGYNFLVGGDGRVYEGRGWNNVGAHATNWNSRSIGIALIGNFGSSSAPAAQTNTARNLIQEAVRRGTVRSDYRLIGHRQVVSTACPGNSLYSQIQSWPRFSPVA